MKNLLSLLSCIVILCFVSNVSAQELSPDKFMNKLLKDDHSMGVKVPGWLIKMIGSSATGDLDEEEKQMVKELTRHIKKLRLLVNTKAPANFNEHYKGLLKYFESHDYEPLVEVRDRDHKVSLWADLKGDVINNLVVTVLNEEETSTFFNIKSNLDIQTLKDMNFFKRLNSL